MRTPCQPSTNTFRGIIAAAAVLAACGGDRADGPLSSHSDFDVIRTEIFAKSCAFSACHSSTDAGGLVLTAGNAYAQLTTVAPTNAVARSVGLMRVTPGSPEQSLLWHKLNWTAGHHAADYGRLMPLGGPPLTVEQVEFVRRWIANGASATSVGVERSLLSGTTAQNVATFAALAPPTSGFQMIVPAFAIDAGKEREIFVYRSIGNESPIFVNRVEIAMRPGSHHFVAYTFGESSTPIFIPPLDQVRDLYLSSGTINLLALLAMPSHVFMAGAQTPMSDYTFPTGVALQFPAAAAIDLNAHYVNSTAAPLTGEVYMNLHTVPAEQVTTIAKALNLANTSIVIPPGRDTTITRTFTFSQTRNVFMVTSHMHKRGAQFVVKIYGGSRHGEVIFSTNDWQHPPSVSFATPIVLQAGEGLTSEVTYHGDPVKTVRFGLTSDDEMGIIAGYWY